MPSIRSHFLNEWHCNEAIHKTKTRWWTQITKVEIRQCNLTLQCATFTFNKSLSHHTSYCATWRKHFSTFLLTVIILAYYESQNIDLLLKIMSYLIIVKRSINSGYLLGQNYFPLPENWPTTKWTKYKKGKKMYMSLAYIIDLCVCFVTWCYISL